MGINMNAAPEPILIEPGIYPGLSNEDYHAGPGISASGLKRFRQSPAHYRYGKSEWKPHFDIGTAGHAIILEPDTFDNRFACVPQNSRRGTKAWQEMETEHAGKLLLKENDYITALECRDAVYNHPVAAELLGGPLSWAEKSGYWIDVPTGLLCRCRPDYANERLRVIVDIKTTTDASKGYFFRNAGKLGYHLQDAHYRKGWDELAWEPDAFVFICIEKDALWKHPERAVGIYEFHPADFAKSIDHRRRLLNRIAECEAADNWPGYETSIVSDLLPGYVFED